MRFDHQRSRPRPTSRDQAATMVGAAARRRLNATPSTGTGVSGPVLVLEVTDDGRLAVAAPRGPVRFAPADIERVRQVLADARSTALWVRGRW